MKRCPSCSRRKHQGHHALCEWANQPGPIHHKRTDGTFWTEYDPFKTTTVTVPAPTGAAATRYVKHYYPWNEREERRSVRSWRARARVPGFRFTDAYLWWLFHPQDADIMHHAFPEWFPPVMHETDPGPLDANP